MNYKAGQIYEKNHIIIEILDTTDKLVFLRRKMIEVNDSYEFCLKEDFVKFNPGWKLVKE